MIRVLEVLRFNRLKIEFDSILALILIEKAISPRRASISNVFPFLVIFLYFVRWQICQSNIDIDISKNFVLFRKFFNFFFLDHFFKIFRMEMRVGRGLSFLGEVEEAPQIKVSSPEHHIILEPWRPLNTIMHKFDLGLSLDYCLLNPTTWEMTIHE